jgi:retron-type reverse transcriptase
MRGLIFAAAMLVTTMATADIAERYQRFQERFTSLARLTHTLSGECRENMSAGPEHPGCQRMERALVEARRMLEEDLGEFVDNQKLQQAFDEDPETIGRIRERLLAGVQLLAHGEATKELLDQHRATFGER